MARRLTPGQAEIVHTLDRPLFVAAGAGSGKSSTLAERVAWALTPGSGAKGTAFLESLDQVLVITFTRAAAEEIKEKIRARLREGGLADQALAVDSAWISTIHAMCSRILRRHAFDLGIDLGFEVLSEKDGKRMVEEAVDEVLRDVRYDEGYASLLRAFSPRDRRGADAKGTLFEMVATLRASAATALGGFDSIGFPGEPASCDDALGSWLDAARRALVLGQDAGAFESKTGTGERANLERGIKAAEGFFSHAPSARTPALAEATLAQIGRPKDAYRKATMREVGAELRSAFAELRLCVAFAGVGPLAEQICDLARKVDRRYARRKAAAGALDNDDLLSLTLGAFRDHPEIAALYGEKFRLVMVDEFQDTNAQQVRMIELLSGRDACHLCTVGDAQQSIYRFRAADVQVFRDRERFLAEGGTGAVVCLDQNFRSHDDVLRLVACLLGKGLVPGFMDLRPWAGRPTSYGAAGLPRVSVEAVVGLSSGRRGVPATLRSRQLARQMAERIGDYVAAGQRADDVALLLGRMSNLGVYLEALRERGIDCVVSGGSTFSDAPEVHVVASLLHVLANPRDTQAGLYPVLVSRMFSLTADDLCLLSTRQQERADALAKRGIDVGLWDFEFPRGCVPSARLVRAREVLGRAIGRLGSWGVADVLLSAIRESGWIVRLERAGADGQAQLANVLAAVRHVGELADEAGLGVSSAALEFDRWLEAAKVGPASLVGGGAGSVKVMTVHASKGLEYPVVAISECWGNDRAASARGITAENRGGTVRAALVPEGVTPLDLRTDVPLDPSECTTTIDWAKFLHAASADGEQAERARLLYVAITRAKEAVILGMGVTLSSKGSVSPTLARGVAEALFGEALPAPGRHEVPYGGSAPASVRVVSMRPSEQGEPVVDDGGADAAEPPLAALEDVDRDAGELAIVDEATSDGLPEARQHAGTWSAREGVFSYSSARAQMLAGEGEGQPAEGDVRPLPEGASLVGTRGDAGAEADDGPMADTADADKATNLGSAFHELAQCLVEGQGALAPGRIERTKAYWRLSTRQGARLDAALARWQDSKLRREVLSHDLVRAELPFFRAVDAPYGSHVEGAIDLVATDVGSTSALVVDYKTGDAGLSLDEVAERHRMQANFYASVLMGEGYEVVTCVFVCVERDGEDGQPLSVSYEFGNGEMPRM